MQKKITGFAAFLQDQPEVSTTDNILFKIKRKFVFIITKLEIKLDTLIKVLSFLERYTIASTLSLLHFEIVQT